MVDKLEKEEKKIERADPANKSKVFIWMIIIFIVVLSLVFYQTPKLPSLTVSDQSLEENGRVTIDSFYLDKPGYVVIHKEADGKPGLIIGNGELVSGSNSNYVVSIDVSQAGTKIFAMLHYDDGDGLFEFPGDDIPVKLEDNIVVKPINLE